MPSSSITSSAELVPPVALPAAGLIAVDADNNPARWRSSENSEGLRGLSHAWRTGGGGAPSSSSPAPRVLLQGEGIS
ncbi:hypothetical protein KSP39_PZI015571 [Platanthera zijinensis]|uniref:Uncharacterized protein n=1 Tax=Platanthera zijinensis TaxID=2320716 RepID=A0AAP0G1I3_9ASPA